MEIRGAREADVEDVCRVVRASIVELCVADHQGDPDILAQWLANKTPENVSIWLSNPNNINLVADESGAVLAAGCVTVSGEILLNYVCPTARFRGVTTQLLAAMEDFARGRGVERCVLASTTTARRFYERRGYRDAGYAATKHGMTIYPLVKDLRNPLRPTVRCSRASKARSRVAARRGFWHASNAAAKPQKSIRGD